MVFGWLSKKNEKEVEKVGDEKVMYAPVRMSVPQKATLIGGSLLGMLGISYILNYVLYVTLGGVCAGVMFYDNERLVGFINERKFLSDDLINKFNENTAMIARYLTPAQVTQGVSEGAKAVGRFSWLAQLGMNGDKRDDKDQKIDRLSSRLDNVVALKKAM